jgi:hypothetical protein
MQIDDWMFKIFFTRISIIIFLTGLMMITMEAQKTLIGNS